MICGFVCVHLVVGDSNLNVTSVCKSGHLLDGFATVTWIAYDGSVESAELCSRTICPVDYFKCHYGACVHRWKKCNGRLDCVDASDERNCGRKLNSCLDNEFYCANSIHHGAFSSRQHCISTKLLCDGVCALQRWSRWVAGHLCEQFVFERNVSMSLVRLHSANGSVRWFSWLHRGFGRIDCIMFVVEVSRVY